MMTALAFNVNQFSKYTTGFLKSHGTQHFLINMFEKWKNVLVKGE